MGRRKQRISASAVTSEGQRQLIQIARRQTYGAIARRVRVDESAIRHYAHGRRRPDLAMRPRLREVLGIPEDAWDASPAADASADESATAKRD